MAEFANTLLISSINHFSCKLLHGMEGLLTVRRPLFDGIIRQSGAMLSTYFVDIDNTKENGNL